MDSSATSFNSLDVRCFATLMLLLMLTSNCPKTAKYYKQLLEAANFVKEKLGTADTALVLGSGLQGFSEVIENKKVREPWIVHEPLRR